MSGFLWRPLSLGDPHQAKLRTQRLASILDSWRGTAYSPGMCSKGQGVDCVRFVCAVLDELHGREATNMETLPQDAALHTRLGAVRGMRAIRSRFMPNVAVRDGSLEPGDVIVTGPEGGGPGHALIVGPAKNTIWHATGLRVMQTGLAFATGGHRKVFRTYRNTNRETWVI